MGARAEKARIIVRQAATVAEGWVAAPYDRRLPASVREQVHVVPHTHWDREWWDTVEGYAPRLRALVERVVELCETEPSFSFTFDGQVAPIDDYLAQLEPPVRAQMEARIRRLVVAGRLHIGPWYTLSDQFLVSGETTLRNLEKGIARAKELGGVMEIAYCPDQFGLIEQLPAILNQVSIKVVMGQRGMARGMPERFEWVATDGSTVQVINLKDGYFHPHLSPHVVRERARRGRGGPSLFLAGYDHALPSRKLIEDVEKAGATLSSLPAFVADTATQPPGPQYRGELRSAGDNCILPNVVSNRVDQRQLVAHAEQELERYAEVLATLVGGPYPQADLDEAWTNQIWNAAHDSACATVIDAVAKAVRQRTLRALSLAQGVTTDSLTRLGAQMKDAGTYVWNPSNFERDLVVETPTGSRLVRGVPALGWSRVDDNAPALSVGSSKALPPYQWVDQRDAGDTYTFDPKGHQQTVTIPSKMTQAAHESFSRVAMEWDNTTPNHRLRLHIALPDTIDGSWTDTPFGSIHRPTVPENPQGRDRLNGFPASKFIVVGGMAFFFDHPVEYEILPDTHELAITLVRSHGALSVGNPQYRLGGAGPRISTQETQVLGNLSCEVGMMPWKDASNLPWEQSEQFALSGRAFTSAGGGYRPHKASLVATPPTGVLSAVTPKGVRTFDPHTGAITLTPLQRVLHRGTPGLG